ncbi:MAG: hypothetical protein Q9227_000959 [Pyrenula ochraceoflavens]
MPPSWLPIIGAFHFGLVAFSQNSISLSPSSSPPKDASNVLDRSFAGFGIEPSNLYSFTGGTEQNDLSVNLLQNLADNTGAPPAIRLGGNTGDYFIWDNDYNDYSVGNNPRATGSGAIKSDSMIIGPSFFKVLDRFPKDTPVIFGLNLAYDESDWPKQIAATANAARMGMKNVNLVAYEVGNEPDLYDSTSAFRTGPWSGQVYTQQWLDRTQAVYSQVLKPNGIQSDFFEPANTASTIPYPTFQIDNLVSAGITRNANGSSKPYIAAWNQHDYYYYIDVSTYELTMELFTDLSTTYNQFESWTEQIKQASDSGLDYYLREMASVGPIGMAGITDTFAASLWTLNFFLYAAVLNIKGVNMHMTDNSNASAWLPIPMYNQDPHVLPSYYAFAAMTSLIGKGCSTRVANLTLTDTPDGYANRIATYAIYQDDSLTAVTVINTKLTSTSSSSSSAQSLSVSLQLDSSLAGKDLHISRLTADSADATSGTTFSGISYESSNDGKPTKDADHAPETVKIDSSGKATFNVRDTEAVIASIGSELGSGNTTGGNCPALAGLRGSAGESGSQATTNATASSASSNSPATSTSHGLTSPTSSGTTNKPSSGSIVSVGRFDLLMGLLVAVMGWWIGLMEL